LTTKPFELRKARIEKKVLFKRNSATVMDIMVDMMTIKCLNNGLSSQWNSHIPFWTGFQHPPPPSYGRILFEQPFLLAGATLLK